MLKPFDKAMLATDFLAQLTLADVPAEDVAVFRRQLCRLIGAGWKDDGHAVSLHARAITVLGDEHYGTQYVTS